MAKRETFRQDEIRRYFDRICFPEIRRIYNISDLKDEEKLAYLDLLQKHHLVKVPWENLVQHYSWHQTVYLNPGHLLKKIADTPGRGGYCMENNFLFHLILYSLGFKVILAGSRIYKGDGVYGGWTHVINLVTIAKKRYLLDSGFGGQGPSRPIPLDSGVEMTQIAPAQMRLVYETIPMFLDQSQRVWVYQHRHDENHSWVPMYCFVDYEFTPADVASMNYAPWLSRYTFFTHKVVSVRFTTNREVDGADGPGSPTEEALKGDIDGSLTINHDTLKWRKHGNKIKSVQFKNEEERIAALQKYFGITLEKEDREAISKQGDAELVASIVDCVWQLSKTYANIFAHLL